MNENETNGKVENDLSEEVMVSGNGSAAVKAKAGGVPPKKKRNWKRHATMFFMVVVVMVLVGCAPAGETGFQPAAGDGICEIYVPAVQWLRIISGMMAGISLVYLGLTRLASSILPDIGVRTGTVIGALVFGLVLAGFGEGMSQGLQYSMMGTFVNCEGVVAGPLG
jgi:hypothetical protein